ncbi:MAG: hypothetical protein KF708_03210 [Pirellulales bacterium]|nr:hypothetical protein [Pirellulales bacterium]
MTRRNNPRHAWQGHRGGVMIVVLLILVLCVALGTRLANNVASGRKVARTEQQELQVDWLADSGVRRAAERLASDAAYLGETWHVAASSLGGADEAVVSIRVAPHDAQPLERNIVVTADYPAGKPQRVRRTREIKLQLTEQGEQP